MRPAGRRSGSAASSTSRRRSSSVPDGVDVRTVDLSIELQILAYHEQRKANTMLAARCRRRRGEPGMSVLVVGHLPPHRPGRGAGAASPSTPSGSRSCCATLSELDARQRGRRALHLQPGRGLRRRRPVPRQRRGALARCSASSAGLAGPTTCSATSTCTTTTAPSPTCSTSPPGSTRWCVGESQILGQIREALRDGAGGRHRRPGAQRALPAGPAGRQARARRDRHRPGRARAWSVAALERAADARRRPRAAVTSWSSAPVRWPR